ncbi:hypothetical protein Ae201684_005515, partial [Aphanomyces euteiches]
VARGQPSNHPSLRSIPATDPFPSPAAVNSCGLSTRSRAHPSPRFALGSPKSPSDL